MLATIFRVSEHMFQWSVTNLLQSLTSISRYLLLTSYVDGGFTPRSVAMYPVCTAPFNKGNSPHLVEFDCNENKFRNCLTNLSGHSFYGTVNFVCLALLVKNRMA